VLLDDRLNVTVRELDDWTFPDLIEAHEALDLKTAMTALIAERTKPKKPEE